MTTDLDRAIWRYRVGRYHESGVAATLDQEIAQLVTSLGESQNHFPTLRQVAPTLVSSIDDEIDKSRQYLASRDYEQSLRHTKQAAKLIGLMQNVLLCIDDLERAKEQHNKLRTLIGSENLLQTMTLDIIDGLLLRSEKLLSAGKHHEARIIAQMCLNDTTFLQTQQPELKEQAAGLSSLIDQIALTSRQGHSWTASTIKLPTSNTCDTLRYLLDNHYLHLVQALLADLELSMTSVRTFLTEYHEYEQRFAHHTDPPHPRRCVAQLRHLITHEGWNAATSELIQKRLETLSAGLSRMQGDSTGDTEDEISDTSQNTHPG